MHKRMVSTDSLNKFRQSLNTSVDESSYYDLTTNGARLLSI